MRGTSCISNKVAVKKDGKNDEYGTQYSIPLYLLWNIWNCIRNTKTEKEVRFYPLTSSPESPSLFFHTLVL